MSKKKDAAFYHPETGELLEGLRSALLSADGKREFVDPTPMATPLNMRAPSGMRELVQELVRKEMSQLAEAHGMETWEESEDFDIDDDPSDPLTLWEMEFDPELVAEKKEAVDKLRAARGVLTPAEVRARVKASLTKEKSDGDAKFNERRVASGDGGSGRSGSVGKGKSVEKQDADDAGRVPEADRGDTRDNE